MIMKLTKRTKRSRPSSPTSKKRVPVFPQRLYDMLENAEVHGFDHVISWMPDGKAFKIHIDGSQNEECEKTIVEVLKKNSFNLTRYRSFLRQLQLYGFERTYRGPHRGECKHELFVRGRKDLLLEKSIEDFQHTVHDDEGPPTGTDQCALQLVSPDSIFILNDNSNYWMPKCAASSDFSGCSYIKQSRIPTKLFNLDMSSLSSSDSRAVTTSTVSSNSSEADEKDYCSGGLDDAAGDFNADWLFFEQDMMRTSI